MEATAVEPEFEKLYSYLFDLENGGYPVEEMDRPKPTAIFVVNFDKVNFLNLDISLQCLKADVSECHFFIVFWELNLKVINWL